MIFLDAVPFKQLLWLVPFFFMLHNLEEAPFMEKWSKRLPIKVHPIVSTKQFVIAVTFLTLSGFILTFLGVEVWSQQSGYLLVLGIQMILTFNAFVPHLVSTIRFRLYSPGVVSALLITLPFSFYLFRRALTDNLLTWNQFWILLGLAPFLMVAFALLSLKIGKTLAT
ncbi:MAG: HXXEE domain-containing protein [Chloroflexi bacterium]|nr:HXXEE domain-containing protein [Chloroflexota bacterium]